MNKFSVFIFLTFVIIPSIIVAQDSSKQVNTGVLSAILRLENYIQTADQNLQRYQKSIDRCDKNIQNSTEILEAARKAGDGESERNAGDAVRKSQKTKQKYVDLTAKTKDRQNQSRETIETLKRKVQTCSVSASGTVLHYSGTVLLTKANGQKVKLSELSGALLENGDVITTGDKSSVELQCLDGRGQLVLGEKSRMTYSATDSSNTVNIQDGKVKISIEKAEAFYNRLIQSYNEYKKYITSPDSLYELELMKLKARVQKKLESRVRVSAVCANRGTEFTVQCIGDTSEVMVLEGSIEMKSLKDGSTVIINSNQMGAVTDEGKLLDVKSIEPKTVKTWWKDEE
jgi:Skp family chaperone for outer membrane proteins